MAMGEDTREVQDSLFVTTDSIARSPGHAFYERLDVVMDTHGFAAFAEPLCARFYAKDGRPSIPPVVYFKMLLIGYFEGLDSEPVSYTHLTLPTSDLV